LLSLLLEKRITNLTKLQTHVFWHIKGNVKYVIRLYDGNAVLYYVWYKIARFIVLRLLQDCKYWNGSLNVCICFLVDCNFCIINKKDNQPKKGLSHSEFLLSLKWLNLIPNYHLFAKIIENKITLKRRSYLYLRFGHSKGVS
jgi:hypothetical protein